ncbi:hypothetical protein [Branchiibius sp. NY16-3462-2]|uniref:hypothetical protein n=1 Tax=Branchiibius sp. NY16-3462-2 TaxID=1807500 RepID=UPI00079A82D9|nr:hypothetical protein [Branchiibius sp. NY16-3462-2]KYH45182.1 hypothetical protein AZH51_14995 [Branchiibius sp. NY16-3462-2]
MSIRRTSVLGLIPVVAALPALAACGSVSTTSDPSPATVTVTASPASVSQTPQAMPETATSVPSSALSAPTVTARHVATSQPAATRQASVQPKAPRPLITDFTASETKVACSAGGPGFPAKLDFDITFTWATKHTKAVYLGVDTTDALHNSYSGAMPTSGSITIGYGCYDPHTYTLAAVGTDGRVIQHTITVKNVGDPGA